MTKIKICGLSRPCDIDYVNHSQPDYCGFIVNVPKSRRNVSPDTLRQLRKQLSPSIQPVGVFVNEPLETIVSLVSDGTLSLVQLHGQEDAAYIAALRAQISVPIIQAFRVDTPQDVETAVQSPADLILLDHGPGGTGEVFDWSLIGTLPRPFLLAGGLTPANIPQAIAQVHPYALDLSSGVETEGFKDPEKIQAAVQAAHT